QFNQIICFNCVIDGGHAQHAVKYDAKMEKVQSGKDLREEITVICSKVDDNKKTTLDKADQMTNLCAVIKKNLAEAEIPQQVLTQLDNIRSDEEASEYKEIVNDLAKTIIDQCDSLTEAFDAALETAK
ncbi:hypothetical protein PMAYCL1PPCAC_09601, partial [Pristionchus mayeri]